MSHRLLLVEDEPGLRRTLGDRLRKEGYRVEAVADATAARHSVQQQQHDLIILDVMLPDLSGFEFCAELRSVGIDWPVLMLTALHQVDQRIDGFESGADDYLNKPFDMRELLVRIRALLRRTGRRTLLTVGCAEVDLAGTQVHREGEPVQLSARLFELLAYMIEHGGQTVTREQLLADVWNHRGVASTRTVDVHIGQLRRIVEHDPSQPKTLVTVHGLGYRLDVQSTFTTGHS
ncbi:MAG: DNA-binding response regulator [Lysobacteraceae bacterium]|nr:MAG: DNA-binding response regulator [Xanthomonadaceae bacterium]